MVFRGNVDKFVTFAQVMNKILIKRPAKEKEQKTRTPYERVGKCDNERNIPELRRKPMQDG